MPKADLETMLRQRRPSDVAVALQCTIDELDGVLIDRRIDPDPEPAELPAYCTWVPEEDEAHTRLLDDGIDEWSAGKILERACLWAVREGVWHVSDTGALIKEMNPELLAQPIEWRPES